MVVRWLCAVTLVALGVGLAPRGLEAQRGGEAPRVALLDGDRGLLVRDGNLYWQRDGRWVRAPLVGASAVDVVSARGALWVLGRGAGALRGHVLVLRYEAPDRLTLVDSAPVGAGFVPRALGVEREAFQLGGDNPPLLRLQRGEVTGMLAGGPGVDRLQWSPDDVLVMGHPGRGPSAWRWGAHRPQLRPGTWRLLVGRAGALGVLADGTVLRGLPWGPVRGPDRLAPPWPPSPVAPVAGAVDAAGRVVLVGPDGAGWRTAGRAWTSLGRLPEAPVALLGAGEGVEPVHAVLRDGRCLALEGQAWVPRVGRAHGD